MSTQNTTRILYLVGGVDAGDQFIGRKIPLIADSWRRAGHPVRLFRSTELTAGTAAPRPRSKDDADYHRKWYHRFPIMAPLVRSISEWRDIRNNAICVERLRQLAAQDPPGLIWQRSCRLHNAGLVVARELNIPYVLEWKDHLIPYRFSWYRGRAMAMEEQKTREADCVVVESNVLRDQLASEGVDRDKIFVAHNAVDPEEFRRDPAAARRKAAVGWAWQTMKCWPDTWVVTAFYHDSERLVLGGRMLRKQSGHKLRILMLGDGKDYYKCAAMAGRLGLLDSGLLMMKPRIPKEEVPGVLAALDIAVLPGSTDIICPIKIQEYMAAELPSVLPDYACNREVIEQGKTGMLFQPERRRFIGRTHWRNWRLTRRCAAAWARPRMKMCCGDLPGRRPGARRWKQCWLS